MLHRATVLRMDRTLLATSAMVQRNDRLPPTKSDAIFQLRLSVLTEMAFHAKMRRHSSITASVFPPSHSHGSLVNGVLAGFPDAVAVPIDLSDWSPFWELLGNMQVRDDGGGRLHEHQITRLFGVRRQQCHLQQ